MLHVPTRGFLPPARLHKTLVRRAAREDETKTTSDGGGLARFEELTETLSALDVIRTPGTGWVEDPETKAVIRLPESTPWAVVYFLGGAGFGAYPQLAYGELLSRLSTTVGGGVVVIAFPYNVALDHGSIALAAEEAFDITLGQSPNFVRVVWGVLFGLDRSADPSLPSPLPSHLHTLLVVTGARVCVAG